MTVNTKSTRGKLICAKDANQRSASFGQGENVGASAYGGPNRPIELLVLLTFSPIKFHQCSTMNFTTVSPRTLN